MPQSDATDMLDTLRSLVSILPLMTSATYLQLVEKRIMTRAEAAAALRDNAALIEGMASLDAPIVGETIAGALRDYAKSFDRRPGAALNLTLLRGGLDDDGSVD